MRATNRIRWMRRMRRALVRMKPRVIRGRHCIEVDGKREDFDFAIHRDNIHPSCVANADWIEVVW